MPADSQILLKSDTNELEIVEFCIDEGTNRIFRGERGQGQGDHPETGINGGCFLFSGSRRDDVPA